MAAILNQNFAYISHILNDSNGRFGDRKELRFVSVLCSLWPWGAYAMCFDTAV